MSKKFSNFFILSYNFTSQFQEKNKNKLYYSTDLQTNCIILNKAVTILNFVSPRILTQKYIENRLVSLKYLEYTRGEKYFRLAFIE